MVKKYFFRVQLLQFYFGAATFDPIDIRRGIVVVAHPT